MAPANTGAKKQKKKVSPINRFISNPTTFFYKAPSSNPFQCDNDDWDDVLLEKRLSSILYQHYGGQGFQNIKHTSSKGHCQVAGLDLEVNYRKSSEFISYAFKYGTSMLICVTNCSGLRERVFKDKAQHAVILDKATSDKLYKDVQSYRLITVATLVDRLKINGSLARRCLADLEEKGQIKKVVGHSKLQIYSKSFPVTNSLFL
ncbi:40S ribosomal protein [Lachnellula hyalina]|uniref:40S ribosomal protein n=1 Tax=Lachnellula hyalina TaxID=1316788 RepID=A0A8H8TX86_9HELO|nr:40S ribosomal protein [Lachnellula hyalina]TVY25734.1 40S ribosomal protein [Lachnellula hyalina]